MKEKRDETIILRLSKTEKNRIYEKMLSMGISISKINAAFLTGQQIDRIHVQQLLLPSFMCQGHNACYCTMCRPKRPLLF